MGPLFSAVVERAFHFIPVLTLCGRLGWEVVADGQSEQGLEPGSPAQVLIFTTCSTCICLWCFFPPPEFSEFMEQTFCPSEPASFSWRPSGLR